MKKNYESGHNNELIHSQWMSSYSIWGQGEGNQSINLLILQKKTITNEKLLLCPTSYDCNGLLTQMTINNDNIWKENWQTKIQK